MNPQPPQIDITKLSPTELWKLISDQKDVVIQAQNQLALAQNNINMLMAEIKKREDEKA